MRQSLIDAVLRTNEDRITLFVSCGEIEVFGSDIAVVESVYQKGMPWSSNQLHHIERLLNNAGFLITVVEHRN